ncbi:dihydrodipicolinate synthase family protein [Hoeflea sp.]|uniref:dihydrodipicolinate synthase family protein n=1 Tax=Hoeflea sp. TaxID=1940281 RepID=UPI003B020767
MSNLAFRGVIAPNLTPFNHDLTIATDLYIRHAAALLDGPCVALAPFGTTGEALSVASAERVDAIGAMIEAGVDPARLVPGTGLTNLPETCALSRKMLELGCAAVMTLPPFYYKGVSEQGLFNYFSALISGIDRQDCRIFLYHIPQVSGVGLPVGLVHRLKQSFPVKIAGIKDSAGDDDNTLSLLKIDDLVVYPGSELPILRTTVNGSPGCISATANLNGGEIARVINLLNKGQMEDAEELHRNVRQTRLIFQDYAPIPAQKRLLAIATGDERWANVRPPLEPLSEQQGFELLDKLGMSFRNQLNAFAQSLVS